MLVLEGVNVCWICHCGGGGPKAQNCDRLFHKRASRNKKVYFPSSTKIPFPWRFRDSSWDGNGRLNDFGSKVEQKGFLGGKVRWPNYYEKNSLGWKILLMGSAIRRSPPFGCIKPNVNNGINYLAQPVSRISEPSMTLIGHHPLNDFVFRQLWWVWFLVLMMVIWC